MPLSEPILRRHDVRTPKLAAVQFAAILIAGVSVMAGDTPPASQDVAPPEKFSHEQRDPWAYQPVRRVQPPAVKEAGWVKNAIDSFILAEIEKLGMAHAPEADRVALIRRVTYDLTGLPPTPEEVSDFADDRRLDAYDRLVDRLLASPQYGQRWGQNWLDLAHYADSNGFELDAERPDA